ncbi:protein lin-37 homolog [Toxorhynchites rutilus septentrionalis]|uniref:protein lin-37 homolog n=1 Tax=Toxorhynchites rutilus septentrionalis TaxID=329112 RepID=UPI002479B20C|nr:protein lin-37 homolog [Toxorhynchites rutilus septentrionalis]
MSKIPSPGGQSLLKVNRYPVIPPVPVPRPATTMVYPTIPRSAATVVDPSIPLRGRPPKHIKMEYMSAAIRNQRSSSFIMKLFDRSVDLSRFEADSPLYPVCRAWMRNQPRNRVQDASPKEPEQRDELPNIIVRHNRKGMKETETTPNVAENELAPFHIEIPFQNSDNTKLEENPTKEQLLKLHKIRWTVVRKKWQSHRRNYLRKYQSTFDWLDAIVVKQRRT